MKRTTEQLLAKALDAIEAAELLAHADKNMIAAGRAFVKRGTIDAKFHRYLLDAFETRQEADYSIDITLDSEAVSELIRRAKEFVQMSKKNLSGK